MSLPWSIFAEILPSLIEDIKAGIYRITVKLCAVIIFWITIARNSEIFPLYYFSFKFS